MNDQNLRGQSLAEYLSAHVECAQKGQQQMMSVLREVELPFLKKQQKLGESILFEVVVAEAPVEWATIMNILQRDCCSEACSI